MTNAMTIKAAPRTSREMIADDAAHFRGRAFYYERTLKTIIRARTASADRLREVAADALKRKPLIPKQRS